MSKAGRGKPPKRGDGYHHGSLRQSLLDEAKVLLREVGPDAVSLRELARRLGVSYGAPHHHFAEKDDLFAALATEAFAALEAATVERIARLNTTDPSAVLRAVAESYLAFAAEDRPRYELMFLPVLRDRVRFATLHATGGRGLDLLTDLFAHAEATSRKRARARAIACWSALHGYSVLANAGFLDDDANPGQRAATEKAIVDSVVVLRPTTR